MVKIFDAIALICFSFLGVMNLFLADDIDKYSYFLLWVVAILYMIRAVMV